MGNIKDAKFELLNQLEAIHAQKDGCFVKLDPKDLIDLITSHFKSNVDLFYNGVAELNDVPNADKGWWFVADKGVYENFANISTDPVTKLPVVTPIENTADLSIISLDKDGNYTIKTVVEDISTPLLEMVDAAVNTINAEFQEFNDAFRTYNTTDSSGNVEIASDILFKVDKNTGENVNYREVTNFADGSPMNDQKVDGVIYIKKSDKYYKRLYEKYVNIDWFSPVKDGFTDDAPKFQAAVNYLKNIGGGILLITNGNYAISHVDFLTKDYSNIEIIGSNNTNIIQKNGTKKIISGYPLATFARYNASDGIFNFNANVSNQTTDENSIKNIKIKNINFISDIENDGFDELSHQISMHGVSGVVIENCRFIGFLGDGIAISRGNENAGFRNAYNKDVQVLNCYFDGINKDNRQGISFYYCDGFKVDFCTFKNICRNNMIGAIDVEADDNLTRSQRGVITNNYFKNIGGLGAVTIFLNNWLGENISHNGYLIQNNDFEDVNRSLAVYGNSEYLNYTGNYGIVFDGNRVFNTVSFFWLDRAFGVKVSNNYFKKFSSVDAVVGYNGVNKILFENNVFEDVKNTSGFAFSGNSKKIDFKSNEFILFKGVFLTINDSKGIGVISENNFKSTEAVNDLVLITANSTTVDDVKNAVVKNNFYGNSSPIDLNFWCNGAASPNTGTIPRKFVYGDSENQMTGTMPIGFVGDGTALVKTIRRNITDNYYPEIYQTLYAAPNNGGNVWVRQAINLDSWGEWRLISNIDKTAQAQSNSSATDVESLKTDFNALLLKLKNAGLMQ